ncbi:hypothetical protein [Croceimicrobium sp.]|uniref:hypothetical protein n=1 Tax=Croceimicrobium sp. TaxID=2828340 RepID=UPI003BAC0B58
MKFPLAILLLLSKFLCAQNLWESQIEQSSLSEQNPSHLEQWANQLQNWKHSPIEINLWDRQKLMETGLFNVFQVHNLMQYRQRYGALLSAAELTLIKGFDKNRVSALLPFLSFKTQAKPQPLNWQSLRSFREHQMAWRWQINSRNLETKNNAYLGDPLESRLIYRTQSQEGLSLGLNLQKDPGEAWQLPYGYDHIAGFLQYQGPTKLSQLILGDYHFSFGQGLSLWSGSAFNTTGFDQAFARYARGISAYAGSEEQRFFRGIATSYQTGAWKSKAFVSFRELDASKEPEPDAVKARIRSDGYHRNEKELKYKDQVLLKSLGLAVQYEGRNFDLSVLHHQHYFAIPLVSPENLSEKHRPSGKSHQAYAMAGQMLWQQFHFFGELALDPEANWAFVLGWERKCLERLRLKQQWRKFQPEYQSFWSDARARSGSAGEFGILQQIEAHWNYQLRSLIEIDYYQFPWPRYQIDGPSAGRRISLIQEWRRHNSQILEIRIRNQWDEKWDAALLKNEPGLQKSKMEHWQVRVLFKNKIGAGWSKRSTLQFYLQPEKLAFPASFMSQQWSYQKNAWRIRICLAVVNDPFSNAVFYDYEPNLLQSFSIPAFRGQSFRLSVYSRWQSRNWQAEIKLAYADDIYYSNAQIELKLQLHYSF